MVNLNECLHDLGLNFVNFAIPMLIQSSVLIVLLLLLTLLLKRKTTAIFLYGLWMLLLIKLLLPVSLASPLSLSSLCAEYLQNSPTTELALNEPLDPHSGLIHPIPSENQSPPNHTSPEGPHSNSNQKMDALAGAPSSRPVAWQEMALLTWLTVATAMTLLLAQRIVFVKRLVMQATDTQPQTKVLLYECCKKMGLKQKIGLKSSPNTTSPAVCGLLKPVILLPQNLEEQLASTQLQLILMHELSHIRRGDLWINLGQTLLQIVYFYNPLLWLANAIIRRIREQAVDESVMVAMNAPAEAYPEALLHVAKLAFSNPSLGLRLVGVVENKNAFKGRMKHMLNRPIPKNAKISVLGMVMILALGSTILPMGHAREASTPDPVQSQSAVLRNETDKLASIDELPTTESQTTASINLQELINAARPKEVVVIPAGVYTEPITIDKSLTLRGESPSDCILQVTANQPAILADSKGKGSINLENLTIQWQLATSDKTEYPCAILFKDTKGKASHCTVTAMENPKRSPSGLRVQGFSNVTVEDCRLQGFEYVIQFMEGTQGVLQDSIIQDCGHQGVINYSDSTMKVLRNVITGSKFHAIRSTGGTLQVENNLLIDNNNRGIYLGNKSCRGVIRNNAIIGNGTGIDGFANASVQILNNLIMNNDYTGIGSRASCRLTIKNNIITQNPRGITVFLQEDETGHRLRIGANAYWNNETNSENCEIAQGSITEAIEFTDADNGDFSLTPGPAQEQGHGLKNPQTIQALWQRWLPIRDGQ